ncbi:ABC transporter permease [Dysosmobacter sp.]|uniref:ABC transporter permease n=1 Tax=Dysosmobacter sp. TaxID=2591382 RepID=UPI002A8F0A39|nr:ABC transporter permease [Dysosmobacter sp.]MDY3281117.1 ABC transporter permease [Dysosmobacter sp.]
MTSAQLIQLFQSAVVFGTVIMFGALGEILTEKSGNLNLGVPGIMYLGGIAGLAASFFYEFNNPNPSPAVCLILSFLAAFAASALGGLLYSFLTITLRANQNVTGLTLTIFGGGVANFFGGSLNTMAGGVGQISVAVTSSVYRANLAHRVNLGWFGSLFLSYGFMVYLAIIVAVAVTIFFTRTRKGLNLRAVGENPATADAAGINVTRCKYVATCIGAGISGMGGLYYTMDYIKGTWANDGTIEALGWLAVALVIFATWKPLNAVWGSYLFGLLSWMYFYVPGLTRSSQELFKMLPYLVTIAVLIAISLRKKRENQPPASLGLPYFREER